MGLRPGRRRLFWLLYAALLLALFEALSAVLVLLVLPAFKPYYYAGYLDSQLAALSDAQVAEMHRHRHDPELGWDYRPGEVLTEKNRLGEMKVISIDSSGARSLGLDAGPGLIAAYGDSVTLGAEVDDDETWEYFLSKLAGTRVLNFGVGGYGTDQALLKIERDFRGGMRARIVILSMISENINRIVNVYRPFYVEQEVGAGFKPVFYDTDGAMRIVNVSPEPLASVAELKQAVERAKPYDFWYALFSRTALVAQFPYSIQTGRLISRIVGKPDDDGVWRTRRAQAVLRHILARFHAHSVAHGYVPVFVFLAGDGHEIASGRFDGDPDVVAAIKRDFADRIVMLDIADLAARERPDPAAYDIEPYRGHLSEYGNRVVARILHEQLRPWIDRARREAAAEP